MFSNQNFLLVTLKGKAVIYGPRFADICFYINEYK